MSTSNTLKLTAATLLAVGGLAASAWAQPAPKPAGDAAAHRWVKTLSNGATIEVVGVSIHNSVPLALLPNHWWGPDGSPLAEPPCDPSGTSISSSNPDVVFRAIVVHISGLPPGADYQWSISPSSGGSRGPARLGGKEIPGLFEAVCTFPKALATCTVGFSVAADPWQTVRTSDGQTSFGHASSIGPSTLFGRAFATTKGAVITVSHDIKDMAVRLVAVGLDGKEYPAIDSDGGGVNNFHQLTAEFDRPPEKIREFRLQTRPYERVEIPGVALKLAGGG
jgi:hypothetical protein